MCMLPAIVRKSDNFKVNFRERMFPDSGNWASPEFHFHGQLLTDNSVDKLSFVFEGSCLGEFSIWKWPFSFLDLLFCFGADAIFRIGFVLLQENTADLLACKNFESICDALRSVLPTMSRVHMQKVFDQVRKDCCFLVLVTGRTRLAFAPLFLLPWLWSFLKGCCLWRTLQREHLINSSFDWRKLLKPQTQQSF